MKILALSDLHGNLINIRGKYDVMIIAGDWSPLEIQFDYNKVIKWMNSEFIPWMNNVNALYKIFIPGNHDLVCTNFKFKKDLNSILSEKFIDNIFYLNHSSVKLLGKKFYGIPDTEGFANWAYMKPGNINWDFDEDTDVLITHQPPKINNVAYVARYGEEFGSYDLLKAITDSVLKINICGHIHEGDHNKNLLFNKVDYTSVYNVAILNEDYKVTYKPKIINLD